MGQGRVQCWYSVSIKASVIVKAGSNISVQLRVFQIHVAILLCPSRSYILGGSFYFAFLFLMWSPAVTSPLRFVAGCNLLKPWKL
ncbi:hypothetical protein Ancab_016744 [Ancistrocladus abbreviatus]